LHERGLLAFGCRVEMWNFYANVLRVLRPPLSRIKRVAHLLLHLLLVSFDFVLYFGVNFEEAVLVEAVDSLFNIQGALPQHGLKFRLLAELTQHYLLVDVVCNCFLVLVGHEGFEILMLRQFHLVTARVLLICTIVPLLPNIFKAEQLRELVRLQKNAGAPAIRRDDTGLVVALLATSMGLAEHTFTQIILRPRYDALMRPRKWRLTQ
jgi:hypothetical protein